MIFIYVCIYIYIWRCAHTRLHVLGACVCVKALTSWHDMVDAGLELSALVIAAPAKESAIVQLGHRGVGGYRACTVARDVCLRYVYCLHCIIEFPGERYFRRVRLQLAGDARGLLPRHAEYLRLAVLAYWHDWKCKCWSCGENKSLHLFLSLSLSLPAVSESLFCEQ